MTGEPLRIVLGSGPPQDGAHAMLAIRISDFARKLGMTLDKVEISRITCSRSRYIAARDRLGRQWIIRVSDHRGTATPTGHPIPHLDLVSLDGEAGYDEACRFLGSAIANGIRWFDPRAGVRQPRRRR